MAVVFSNNAVTTLAAGIDAAVTSVTVQDGSVFPALVGSNYTYVTFENPLGETEIVKVTAISGNTLTVVRAQDNTPARAFSSASKCELRLTAALLNEVAAQADTDTVYTHPANHAISVITGLQTALDGKVDDSQVLTNVPANAVFTDTVYTLPAGYATETYVGTAISNLVDTAPATLDTLNELAAALGDDPDFATTVSTSIGLKAPLANPAFTGNPTAPSIRASSGAFYINRSNDGVQAIRVDADGVVIIPNNYFYVSASQGSYFSNAVRFRGIISNDTGANVTFGQPIAVSGTVTATGGSSTNWNTAYTWGNHAGLYAAASHNHSGVYLPIGGKAADSELLDGIDSTSFLRSDADDTASGQYTFSKVNDHAIRVGTIRGTVVNSQTGEYIQMYNRVNIGSPDGWGSRGAPTYGLSTYGGADLATDTGSVTISGNTAWHAGNDGSGSGLDADLLDGMNATDSRGGNTIVMRQANGYMQAVYVNTTDDAASTSLGWLYGQRSNSDGYHRRFTAASVRDWGGFFTTANDGSGSGLDADTVDGLQGSQFVRSDTNTSLASGHKWTFISGAGGTTFSANNYSMGVDYANGAWSSPHYSDLIIGYHTGIRIGAAYTGVRFYNNSPTTDANNDGNGDGGETLLMTVGGHAGGSGVVVANTLNAGNLTIGGSQVLSVGNYNSYAPTRTGGGASGSWPISITGTANTLAIYTNRTDGTFYQAMWTTPGSTTAYSSANSGITIRSSAYGAIGFNNSSWYLEGNATYGLYTNTGIYAAGGLWDVGNRVFSAANYPERTNFENGYNNLSTSTGPSANLNTAFQNSRSGFIDCWSGANLPPGTSHVQGIQARHSTGGHYGYQLVNQYNQQQMWHRQVTNSSFGAWNQIWSSSTDGSGSGLDADLLDGVQGASYLRSDATDSASGLINFTGGLQIEGNTVWNGSDTWCRIPGATGVYFSTYAGGVWMQDTTWVRVYGDKALYVANQIAATGNITAYYSDERLKTKTGSIDNAIDKVQSLHGFTYVENELARSLGYVNENEQVALSAQDVQRVMPQAVSLAPCDMETDEFTGVISSKSGENYLTVDYARLVPLLVEAIKELKSEVDDLKQQMENK